MTRPSRPPLICALCLLVCSLVAHAPAEIVINEIMFHPAHGASEPEDSRREFIELINTGGEPVEVGGWRFTRGIAFTLPAAAIPPGDFLVVAADEASFRAAYPGVVATVVGGWSGQLSNSGETVELSDGAANVIDSVRYSDEGDWADRRPGLPDRGHTGWRWEALADGEGPSLELRATALSNDHGQNWHASTPVGGTPGAANSVATTDSAPIILDVAHRPAVPRPGDAVTVGATVMDELADATLAVTLRWRISTGAPGAFQTAPMATDGSGHFSATIPPQAPGTVVEFYVAATDASSNTRTWPGATDSSGTQGANAHFQVDAEGDDLAEGFYRLVMTAEENTEFTGINRSSNAEMNTTFIARSAGGYEIRYRCGTRIRGASSRGDTPPPLRVNLPGDHPLSGRSALNLNTQFTWLQFIGMKLFLDARIATPEVKRVQVRRNGVNRATGAQEQYGSYVHVEPIGSEFVERHFPADDRGNAYKKVRPDNDWRFLSGNVPAYESDGWLKRSNRAAADWSDLDHFLDVMNNAAGAPDYLDQVATVADIDQWMRWFGIMTLLANGETNLSNGVDDDYSIYFGAADPRMKIIPHDLDTILSFGDGSRITDPQRTIFDMTSSGSSLAPLVPFFAEGTIRQRYFAALDELMRDTFSAARFEQIVRNGLGDWAPAATVDAIISFMAQRRNYIASVIHRDLTAAAPLPSLGGFPYTLTPTTNLSGEADPTLTRTVHVDGEAADFDPATGGWAIADVPLNPGINRVSVESFDAMGTLIGSRTLDVWYDDSDTAPLTVGAGTTVLTASGGPYTVDGQLTVPAGSHLEIEAGTSIFFSAGAAIVCEGTLSTGGTRYDRCYLGPDPAGAATWDAVGFRDSRSPSNSLAYSDFVAGGVTSENSEFRAHGCTFGGNAASYLTGTGGTLRLTECEFAAGPALAVNVSSQTILELTGCSFGAPAAAGGDTLVSGSTFDGLARPRNGPARRPTRTRAPAGPADPRPRPARRRWPPTPPVPTP